MKTWFRNNRNMTFGQLQKGDVFARKDGISENCLFIKTEELVLDEKAGTKVGYPTVNALYVSDGCFAGTMFFFDDDTRVEKMYNPQLIVD